MELGCTLNISSTLQKLEAEFNLLQDIFIAFFRTQNNHTDAIRNSGHRNKLLSNFEVPKFSKWSQSRNLKAQAQPKKGSNTLKINKCLTFLDQQ